LGVIRCSIIYTAWWYRIWHLDFGSFARLKHQENYLGKIEFMEKYSNYAEMRRVVGDLFQDGKFDQAAAILEWGLGEFPDNLLANTYNLATCYAFLEQPDRSIQALAYGLERGIWYGRWDFEAEFWNPVKALDSFERIRARSEAYLEAAQVNARPEQVIVLPSNYRPDITSPLFIALHGGGESIESFKPHWTSPRLESEFITVYLQSSRVVSMTGFSWMGNDQDRMEILRACQSLLTAYPVDTDRILMGGFSSGGHMTLTLFLDEDEILPMKGFIVLCPPVPEHFPPESIARIVSKDQRGVLLTTEMDNRVEDQRRMAAAFKESGVPFHFEVMPNIGHWYPPDLGQRLDSALSYILD